MIPLISFLEKIEDPRKNQGKRYKLMPILLCCFLATICGYKNYSGYAEFCKNYEDSLGEVLGFGAKKTPCVATFFNHSKIKNKNSVFFEVINLLF